MALSSDIHITSCFSLSQLATVIMHAIIPLEAELFKNKIENRALLAKFDPENLSHITYAPNFFQHLHRSQKWHLVALNLRKSANRRKSPISAEKTSCESVVYIVW